MDEAAENIGETEAFSPPVSQNNYIEQPKPKRRRAENTEVKSLSPAQLQDLFRVTRASERDEAAFRVAYCKGLRASEVGRLQMSDYDDRSGRLRVTRGKGSFGGEFPMHDLERRALKKWLRLRGPAPGPIFSSRNHRPISRRRLDQLMKLYCRLAGIPGELAHFHVLKHSRGMHLLEETDALHVVQDALGHVNIANTVKYARATNRRRIEAVEKNKGKY